MGPDRETPYLLMGGRTPCLLMGGRAPNPRMARHERSFRPEQPMRFIFGSYESHGSPSFRLTESSDWPIPAWHRI